MEGMILTMKKKIAGENLQHNQLHLITNVSNRNISKLNNYIMQLRPTKK